MKLRYLALVLASVIVNQGLNAANPASLAAKALNKSTEAAAKLAQTYMVAPDGTNFPVNSETVSEAITQGATEAVETLMNPEATPGMQAQALAFLQSALEYAQSIDDAYLASSIQWGLATVAAYYETYPVATSVIVGVASLMALYATLKFTKCVCYTVRHPINATCNAVKGVCYGVRHPISATCHVAKGVCSDACAMARGTRKVVSGTFSFIRHPIATIKGKKAATGTKK